MTRTSMQLWVLRGLTLVSLAMLCQTARLSAGEANVTWLTTSGQQRTGNLISKGERLLLKTEDGQTQPFDKDQLIWLQSTSQGEAQTLRAKAFVHLNNQNRIAGSPKAITGAALEWEAETFGPVTLPIKEVVYLQLREGVGAVKAFEKPGAELINGDRIKGQLTALTAQRVVLKQGEQVWPLPRERVARIWMRPAAAESAQQEAPSDGRWVLRLADGQRVSGEVLAGDGKGQALLKSGSMTWSFQQSSNFWLWSESKSILPLTHLKPTAQRRLPQFDEAFPVRFDAAPTVGGQAWPVAVQCHPDTQIEYAIPEGFQRFVAQVALADSSLKQAEAVFIVHADDREVARETLKAGMSPKSIAAELKGAKRLRLRVAFGKQRMAFGAHAAWLHPVFVK